MKYFSTLEKNSSLSYYKWEWVPLVQMNYGFRIMKFFYELRQIFYGRRFRNTSFLYLRDLINSSTVLVSLSSWKDDKDVPISLSAVFLGS